MATLYASTLRLLYRRIALHDLKTPLLRLLSLMERPSPTSIHRGFCIITSLISLTLNAMVGSTPSNGFPLARSCARIAFRYTRATWMRLAMIRFGDWAMACNLKLIVIPSHLLTCRSFSHVHIQLVPFGIGHEVNHNYIHIRLTPHPFSSLSLDRPFSVKVDCTDIYTYFLLFSTFACFKFISSRLVDFIYSQARLE